VALVLATATPSWPEDGSRDSLTRAAQAAGARPAYHLVPGVPFAQAGGASGAAGASPMGGDSGQANLAEISHKLANPVSDVWALSTEFDLFFSSAADDGSFRKVLLKFHGNLRPWRICEYNTHF
jgi:hypothetical protein